MGYKAYQWIVIIAAMMFFLNFATLSKAVTGGEEANRGEFPHAVQLYSIDRQHLFCGGSIIAPSVIITAAHCFREIRKTSFLFWTLLDIGEKSPESILVIAGTVVNLEWSQLEEKEGESVAVDRYVKHPQFDSSSLENDIALLFLKKPLIYNDKVQPVQLPPPNVIFPRGTVAGWGLTGEGNTSVYLKKLELDFEDRESCNNDPLMIEDDFKVLCSERCSKSKKGGSTCKGDSGSSVVCQRPAFVPDQVNGSKASLPPPTICGIVSWGKSNESCGESDKISVFVDVSQYLDWIQNTMEAEGFGNLTKPLTCSEPEGFFDCGEFGLDGERIKSRCILIGGKCDGVNNCDENRQWKMPSWTLFCVILGTLVLIAILIIAISYWFWNRSRSNDSNSSEA